jgi:hypothetical protein
MHLFLLNVDIEKEADRRETVGGMAASFSMGSIPSHESE